MVYLADFSLNVTLTNPKRSELWNRITENCVHNGKGYFVDVTDQNDIYSLFGLSHLSKEPLPATDVLNIIVEFLSEKYRNGMCAQYMIHGEDGSVKPNIITSLPPSPLEAIAEITTISTTPATAESIKEFKTNKASPERRLPDIAVPAVDLTPPPVPSVPEVKLPKNKFLWCC